MWRVYGGAVLLIVGIAALIEEKAHQPATEYVGTQGQIAQQMTEGRPGVHVGLSKTADDLLSIGAWALVILGVLTVVLGLLRYRRGA
jgi:uncharacterized membrane protein HdeD (DUF308 family)